MAVSVNPIVRVFSGGVPVSNAKIYVYQTGTTTPVTTYSDGTLSTPNTNPVITDVNGEATIYVAASTNLRYYITTSAGVLIKDIDPVYPSFVSTGLTATISELNLLDSDSTVAVYASSNNLVLKASTGIQLNNDQPLLDSSGNAYLSFTKTASAVNYLSIFNNVTGSYAGFIAAGADTNTGIYIKGKGTGGVTSDSPGSSTVTRWHPNSSTSVYELSHDIPSLTSNKTVTWPNANVNSFVLQRVVSSTGSVATGTTVMVLDNTIPQNTEGDQYMTATITPTSATSILEITVTIVLGSNTAGNNGMVIALFQDSTANALAAVINRNVVSNGANMVSFSYAMTSGTTSATTFKVRAGGSSAGTTTFNGEASGALMGGVMASSIVIHEYSA